MQGHNNNSKKTPQEENKRVTRQTALSQATPSTNNANTTPQGTQVTAAPGTQAATTTTQAQAQGIISIPLPT